MSCCGGSSSGPRAKYELTTPDGQVRVYLTATEAEVARSASGGGTIRVIR